MKRYISFLRCLIVCLISLACCNSAFCDEIHSAARDGDLVKVKMLIQADPKLVSKKDGDGRTPLHWAAAEGHKEVVEFLLENKADVQAKDNDGQTPYQLAAFDKGVAELLKEHGGRKTTSAKDHDPAIFDAASDGDLAKVKELVEDDPDIVFFKSDVGAKTLTTPLAFAAINNHLDVAKYLLDHKADPNAKDVDNQTPLIGAVCYDHKEMVELLLSSGANINAVDTNAALDKDTAHGRTALHYAAFSGFKNIVQVLLDHNADINIEDRNRETPLGLAKINGHKDVVELLHQYGGR